jgi:hypothetical protein
MFRESHLGGVLFSPLVIYFVLGAVIFMAMRYLLGRIGLLQWVWHTALFELALFVCITSAIILLAA